MEHIKDILGRAQDPSNITKSEKIFPSIEEQPLSDCEYYKSRGQPHLVLPLKETGELNYAMVVPCRKCTPVKEIVRLLNVSSLDTTFESFKVAPGTKRAFDAAKAIASLKTSWKLLLLYGINGNGKTHLLEAITNEIFKKNMWAAVTPFPTLIGRLKETFDKSKEHGTEPFEEQMRRYCTQPFLLLDDVGMAGSYTDFSKQQLERIILERYREPLLTVITTNRDIDELPVSVLSRFRDAQKSRIVLNEGKDYRPEKKTNA